MSTCTAAVRAGEAAFISRIRLRAQREALWLRHEWSATPAGYGLSIAHEEVDRILSGGAAARDAFYASSPEAQALEEAIERADAATGSDARLAHLAHTLDLDAAETDLLTLTVAVELDPWMRRVCGYLHDDATSGMPTPWLAARIFDWDPSVRIDPACGLARWRLAKPVAGQAPSWSQTASWSADPFVVDYLTRGIAIDLALGDAVAGPDDACGAPPPGDALYPAVLEGMRQFVTAIDRDAAGRRPMEIALAAPAGAGKRTVARQLAANLGFDLVVADASRLFGPHVDAAGAEDAWARIVRTVRLSGAALYLDRADAACGALRRSPAPWLSILGVTGDAPPPVADGAVRRTFRLPALSQAARAALWSTLSQRPVPASVVEWPLTPASIARAAAAAGGGPEAIADACRSSLGAEVGALATRLERPYTRDDLVLAPSTRLHLDELESQARLRWEVYEEWGFGRLCPTGKGLAALFAGPSGTGKTMAAQVLARSLGPHVELYRIDLAGVMSKYIGETEKHLRQMFDACERANVVLLFDEADALFGQRMQVKDAHDRFANIEIDYLLQRMEQFDGISILSTNRKHEIDQAFLRRIRFIVDFLPPEADERRALWMRALPERAPDGALLLDGIDWDFLARKLAMNGAGIKNAAMGAAFLARAAGSRIAMSHVMQAARREMAKHGLVLRAGDVEG